jgi:putative tricarboxylic transport membrane protein
VRTVNVVAGAFFIGLSALVLIEGLGLQFYVEGVPGPGFFPTLLAITLALCAALLIAMSLAKPAQVVGEFEPPTRAQAQRSWGAWAALLMAVFAIDLVGFVIAMFLLVAVLLLLIERRRGIGTILTIVLTPLLAYLLFGALLQVRLPTGLFGD